MNTKKSTALRMAEPLAQNITSSLEGARVQIEQRFLDGGAVMVSVLDVFTRLMAALEQIGNSLNETEAEKARSELLGTARLLDALPAAQTARQERLVALCTIGRSLAAHIVSMEETLRYLRTFAMTAKIAGAGIPDFADFASEIAERIQFATKEVQALSERINTLGAMIASGADAGSGSLDKFEDAIPVISRSLVKNAEEIQSQRRSIAAIAAKVTELARKVQGRMAGTLSSLQIGDITRQRIEHCQSAFSIAEEHVASTGLGEHERRMVSLMVTKLVEHQLSDIVGHFDQESGKIVGNIRSFSADVAALMSLYQTMIPEGDGDQAGAMHTLQASLEDAQGVASRITAAVAKANTLSAGTGAVAQELGTGVETIQLVRSDIHYMALNTNLRCSRLGEEGRAINVVTGELRAFSQKLDESADAILEDLENLKVHATALSGASSTAEPTPCIAENIEGALTSVKTARATMDANMDALRECGQEISIKVTRAVAGLDFNAGIGETLADCAQRASLALTEEPDCSGLHDILNGISAAISKTYTMKEERDIHAYVFGEPAAQEKVAVAPADDEDLFADALF
jgi:methyl-accepting chemotaxis protein